jgi:hypothetical protein
LIDGKRLKALVRLRYNFEKPVDFVPAFKMQQNAIKFLPVG